MNILLQSASWSDMGIWPHGYACFDSRIFNVRVGNDHICRNLTIDHTSPIGQHCPLPNPGLALEDHIGFDDSFRPNFDIHIDIGSFWIGEGYSIDHVLFIDPLAHNSFCCGQGNPVIDTQTFVKITQNIGPNLLTCLTEDRNNVGQIIFTLGIVGVNLLQSFKKALVFKEIGPCIDFLDLFFKIIGIFLLHNLDNFTIRIADNAAIAKRIVGLGGQNGCHIFMADMEINQVSQTFPSYQRRIPRNDQGMAIQTS